MIGPDLVRVRKKNGALSLPKPSNDAQARALALAEQVLLVLSASVGEVRTVLEEALNELAQSVAATGVVQTARSRATRRWTRLACAARCFHVPRGRAPIWASARASIATRCSQKPQPRWGSRPKR